MSRLTWWLVGGLVAAVGLFAYSRSQRGQTAIAATLDTTPVLQEVGTSAIFQDLASFSDYIGNAVKDVTGSILPEGIRNNNPGNMRWSAGINWQGQTGQDAKGFIIFDTMADGVRAMVKELVNYSNLHGLDTVQGIITRWSATDQDAYVANVSRALGVDDHETIDVTDPNTMAALVRAIVNQENGTAVATVAVSDATIYAGIQEGLA